MGEEGVDIDWGVVESRNALGGWFASFYFFHSLLLQGEAFLERHQLQSIKTPIGDLFPRQSSDLARATHHYHLYLPPPRGPLPIFRIQEPASSALPGQPAITETVRLDELLWIMYRQ